MFENFILLVIYNWLYSVCFYLIIRLLFKNIEDITPGDKILSFTMDSMAFEKDLVVGIPNKIKKYKNIKVIFEDGTFIECLPAHPIWVKGKG
ncbi:hypothetical protein [Nonlabens xiamenensis]|uniref:hypothetical protein n=1 Tax=Nonlabens xiamenensis TaxID=2341043 RepID=UPI000F60DA4F|nr:hypothetical protein [Nonlabens xiamenensis]